MPLSQNETNCCNWCISQLTLILRNSIRYQNESIRNNVMYHPNITLRGHNNISNSIKMKPMTKYSTKCFVTLNRCGYDRIGVLDIEKKAIRIKI